MTLRNCIATALAMLMLSATALAADTSKTKPTFDPQLAAELGADEYGMHKYVMALLKAGPNRDQDQATAAELQRAHMANIQRLAEEGVLVLAGPFLDGGELRGIYIFDVDSVEEARKLTETDPAVKAGRLVMELHPWYGSAAVKKINQLHGIIAKQAP
ncbi:YciI family protein [Microbulbifer pacificus]|uniref:YciI family protein n=1 Tax=Microbulbifer pacificus TaxID=407164 RepID=A0AAU0MW61_9GAMM|nr:YciI family protein [Microbulbifer pacificus]WOX04291.1 YciI family protein [Microbulbifer pacificus]